MSQLLETPLAVAGQVDWDAILDSAFQMGNYSRVTRVNDWTVVTGMQINFPEVWNQAPSGSTKLLVLADTINFAGGGMRLIAGTSTILMGRVIAPKGRRLFIPRAVEKRTMGPLFWPHGPGPQRDRQADDEGG